MRPPSNRENANTCRNEGRAPPIPGGKGRDQSCGLSAPLIKDMKYMSGGRAKKYNKNPAKRVRKPILI
jgi:hypothetical protein